jgi:ribokinase
LFGEQMRLHLHRAGVGVAAVKAVEGPTGIAAITVAASGENCIVVTPGANAALSPEYVEQHRSLIARAGMVLAQLEIPVESVEKLAEICEKGDIPLVLDPAPAQPLSSALLQRVQWVTPNENEAEFYSNRLSPERLLGVLPTGVGAITLQQTARTLLAQGPRNVILKLGSRGAYLVSDDVAEQVPAPFVDVVDTTAAGDALNGAFAVAMMRGETALESVKFAVAAASISVARSGAQPSMPTINEVARALEWNR